MPFMPKVPSIEPRHLYTAGWAFAAAVFGVLALTVTWLFVIAAILCFGTGLAIERGAGPWLQTHQPHPRVWLGSRVVQLGQRVSGVASPRAPVLSGEIRPTGDLSLTMIPGAPRADLTAAEAMRGWEKDRNRIKTLEADLESAHKKIAQRETKRSPRPISVPARVKKTREWHRWFDKAVELSDQLRLLIDDPSAATKVQESLATDAMKLEQDVARYRRIWEPDAFQHTIVDQLAWKMDMRERVPGPEWLASLIERVEYQIWWLQRYPAD